MLNIDYSMIDSIESLNTSDSSTIIIIKIKRNPDFVCPFCGQSLLSNGFYSKRLKHSALNNRRCTIIYKRRRYFCSRCDITLSEPNPFSSSRETITYETKINILKKLKKCNVTYTDVAIENNLSVQQVIRLFDKHVSFPRKTLPKVLSIDEHYFPSSDFKALYMCILMDFDTGLIVDVIPDRKKDYLSNYFNSIRNTTFDFKNHSSELSNVKYVSIDLYDIYKDLARTYFPSAVICADSFHVIEHLTNAFRSIRTSIRKTTKDDDMIYLLTKFKYVFQHSTDLDNEPKFNKRFNRYMNQRDILTLLCNHFPKLKLAYELKEAYIQFNATSSFDNAKDNLSSIIERFAKSGIDEYVEFTNLLINWYDEIINSFSLSNGKRINNSSIESRNSKIERLIYNANGFTNFKRFRNRIIYCLNPNDNFRI